MINYFVRENLQLHYKECDSFVLSIRAQNILKLTRKTLNFYLNSVIWMKIMYYSVIKRKKTPGKFKIGIPKTIWLD